MCGIAGIFNVDGKPVSVSVLKDMTDVIRHRGPDGEGFWTQSFVGLGHRRLAILDLSPLGHQPMRTDDGRFVISYNGEVYNFREIREELIRLGHVFYSSTDTEVVLKAYAEWGRSCIERFNGMFALAVWDDYEKVLVLARDRFGVKPLYWSLRGSTFVFASEIKAILKHPEMSTRLSMEALSEYFTFQNVFSDLTLFDGVFLLPSGCTLSLRLGDASSLRIDRYWDYDFHEASTLADREEYIEELDRLFTQAVRRQFVSDVEIGCYLSGGMDSGAITCVAAKQFRNLKSFTCGFDLSSASGMELSFDERTKAEFLSNLYKTEHYEVVLKAGDMERIMPELVWHLEDLRVGQSYPNYYVARLASKFVKVVLSGAGGDEIFAGYPWRYYRAVVNVDIDDYASKYYSYWQRLIDDDQRPSFFNHDVASQMNPNRPREIFRGILAGKKFVITSPEEYLNASLYFESRTFLHGLLLVEDKLSMAHGLETRVPFLDNDLVDFAARVPIKYKLRNLADVVKLNENDLQRKHQKFYSPTNDGKVILRDVVSRYVPHDYSSGIKQGFSAPDASWFKGESIDYIRSLLLDKRARIYDYVQYETVNGLLSEHFSGQVNRRLLIWSLLCFEWWNRVFDKRGAEA